MFQAQTRLSANIIIDKQRSICFYSQFPPSNVLESKDVAVFFTPHTCQYMWQAVTLIRCTGTALDLLGVIGMLTPRLLRILTQIHIFLF
jgi:hypothetical protein